MKRISSARTRRTCAHDDAYVDPFAAIGGSAERGLTWDNRA